MTKETNAPSAIEMNLKDLKSTRKRSEHREYIDSFEVADIADDGSFTVDTPEHGAAIATYEQFGFADVDELKSKIQSAINAATQANKDMKFKTMVYGGDSLLVIRLA